MVWEIVQSLAASHFLQISGLLGALALIPLLIFYLVRKKPEEQVMPSMMFFMKNRKSGKAHNALRTLLRNLLLLFHILLVLGFAAALAHPFFEAPATADQTVVVFDKSASMSDDLKQAKQFTKSNLGNKNTLITVADSVNVPLEKASKTRTSTKLRGIKTAEVETDLATGLELASEYEGAIVIASDMDQTSTQTDVQEIVENLRNNDRTVKIMDHEEKNSWGIIDVEPGEKKSSVDVKNFLEREVSVQIQSSDQANKLEIGPGSVETVSFSMSPGKNVVKLEEDDSKADNTAYISVPQDKNYKVVLLSDSGNKYFEKAVELISFTSIEVVTPPVQKELNADVYVVGETNRVLSETLNEVEEDVKSGSSLIVFGHSGVFNLGFKSLPVKQQSKGYTNTTVNIKKPQKTTFETQTLDVKKTRGSSYASPEGSIVKAKYGEGEVLFYNVKDQDFRHKFIYPVFWKHILQEMIDRPSVEQLNIQTGERIKAAEIRTPEGKKRSGELEPEKTGFYNTSNGLYAANLLSEDESYAEEIDVEKELIENILEQRDVQNLGAILIAVLILLEMGYLARIGEI